MRRDRLGPTCLLALLAVVIGGQRRAEDEPARREKDEGREAHLAEEIVAHASRYSAGM